MNIYGAPRVQNDNLEDKNVQVDTQPAAPIVIHRQIIQALQDISEECYEEKKRNWPKVGTH
jgi:hypothetical protein